jgi:CelD/BcsL family acetyltransferase involved in cellulose biosynthesis
MADDVEIFCLHPNQALGDSQLLEGWRELLSVHGQTNALYGSPDWVAHLASLNHAEMLIWFVRGRKGKLLGVLPMVKRPYLLPFDIANRPLCKAKFQVAELLGSVPTMPESERLYARTFEQILGRWPECQGIYIDALPSNSYCTRFVHNSPYLDFAFAYSPFGQRPWHIARLGASFEEYLASMSTKSRFNLRRQVRRLEQSDDLEIKRCLRSDEVAEFFNDARIVNKLSWQYRNLGFRLHERESLERQLEELANRGVLRSYVLRYGGRPCAFVIGYQYRDVFHYAEVGFDSNLGKWSPGTVLLFLIIQDLYRHNPPAILNFGVGDATYKRRFGTHEYSDESLLILRHTMRNRLITGAHGTFISCLEKVKQLVGRRVHD